MKVFLIFLLLFFERISFAGGESGGSRIASLSKGFDSYEILFYESSKNILVQLISTDLESLYVQSKADIVIQLNSNDFLELRNHVLAADINAVFSLEEYGIAGEWELLEQTIE